MFCEKRDFFCAASIISLLRVFDQFCQFLMNDLLVLFHWMLFFFCLFVLGEGGRGREEPLQLAPF